jgi:hypothetical protein
VRKLAKRESKSNLPQALEEKNKHDFQEVTNRIWAAIEKITLNSKCKPTQSVLAKLALVSRGTINNRKWPLEELNKIKAKRRQADSDNSVIKKVKPDGQTEMSPEDRLYLNREELRLWKVKADEESRKVVQLEAIIKTQQAQIEVLKSEVTRLADVISENKIVAIKFPQKN